MAMTVVASGKMYNGKVFEWEDKKTGDDRSVFRGRLNYRDRTTGKWEFIDVVCWKDFGDKGGLVAWLDDNFSTDAESSPTDKGGQPIEIMGYLTPSTTKTNDLVGETKSGKKGKVDVIHPTYELVIESADFPPAFEKYKGGNERVDDDFEFDEEDDIEDEEDDIEEPEDIEDDEEEEEVVEPPKRRRTTGTTGRSARATNKTNPASSKKDPKKQTGNQRKRNRATDAGEDDPFFSGGK